MLKIDRGGSSSAPTGVGGGLTLKGCVNGGGVNGEWGGVNGGGGGG